MAAALEMRGVVKRYGRLTALDGLDLSVPRGALFGLVGSNGAGKTTAMALCVGLLRGQAGRVDLFGEGPFDPLRHSGRVTLLPQDARLPLHARVGELLIWYAELQGLSPRAADAAVAEALEWVHLGDRRLAPVRTLSHGMMRRVTIAQAFLGRPELVLLDEPMSGLDPREAARVRRILRRRHAAQTVVISSHDLRELESLCDTAAFVEHGRLVRQDSMEALTRRGKTLLYYIRGTAPLAALRTACPEAGWVLSADGVRLTAQLAPDGPPAESVNARALPVLLESGVGVLEIRRGASLESEYLAATRDPACAGDSGAAELETPPLGKV